MGDFLILPPCPPPPTSRPIFQPRGPYPSLEAQIPLGWDLGIEDGIYLRWDLGSKVRIWASRQRFGPGGWDIGLKAEIWALRWGEYKGEGEEGENSSV